MSNSSAEVSNISPRTQLINNVVAKHPHISISKAGGIQPVGAGSPTLKRKRSSSTSSPDIRRKILERTVETKFSSSVMIQEHMKRNVLTNPRDIISISPDGSVCSLEEINDECFEEEERSIIDLVDISVLDLVDESIELAEASSANKIDSSPKDVQNSPKKEVKIQKQALSSLASAKPASLTNSPKESPRNELKDPSKQVQWVEVKRKRSRRKTRIYFIEAKSEDEGFKAVHKSGEKLFIPSCVNGRKPFSIVPGIDYSLEVDAEEVGEALAENDDKELKLIQNENYLLDSFCCDTGYLSDEELNETPNPNRIISRVKQQRRANNIKDKRKFETLNDPQILGPFWWTGKGGCKKEIKKWQPMMLADSPISTGFSTSNFDDELNEKVSGDEQDKDLVSKQQRIEQPPATLKSLTSSLTASLSTASTEDVAVDHNEKYSIKYLVKFLVEKNMRSVQRPEYTPVECSTPMSTSTKKSNVKVMQEHLKYQVLLRDPSLNRDFVDKYVAKYYNKFKYCDVTK